MEQNQIERFKQKIASKTFPCVGARAAFQKGQLHGFQAGHLGCPHDDERILGFIYKFIDEYRKRDSDLFHSAFVTFTGPEENNVQVFEKLFWQRLQSLADLDARKFGYDRRVSKEPSSPEFSFSLKEEAFFIIALHPGAERPARQFECPVIVFNPHHQFELLRTENKFEKIKAVIRNRDRQFNGSINPLLADYGNRSEVLQYIDRPHSESWKCPLHLKHEESRSNTPT